MLSVEDVSLSFGRHRVLDNIRFTLGPGLLCGLFGPNGSGKTTLFQCCLGFIRPDQGRVRVRGRDIRQLPVRELARHMAYVPQHHDSAFPFMVEEVVLMGRTPHMNRWFRPSRPDRTAAARAMDRVGISDLARVPYDLLSGGQQQLALIARAIAQDTAFILLDEPTSALDFRNQTLVWEILRELADQGRGILACSHDPNHVAWFCDTTLVMDPNGPAAMGEPARIFSQALMDRIYGGACRVSRIMGKTFILPRGIIQDSPQPERDDKEQATHGRNYSGKHRLEQDLDVTDPDVAGFGREKLQGFLGG